MKEVLEKAIYPGFAAQWKAEHGQEVHFTSSFAGSETVTNQILQGAGAQIAILSSERDAERLRQGGAVNSDWRNLPHKGIINETPFLIVVRQGNPKRINDFADLAKAGIKLIHPDPISSGGAQWSILAIYGSELKKAEQSKQVSNSERSSLDLLKSIWRNVISTPGSAREARTQFETGFGDALITYEQEALLMKEAGKPIEIVVPESTITSEHPVVIVARNVSSNYRQAINAFVQYLWSDEAQQAFVRFHLRSVTDEHLNDAEKSFAHIRLPFTVEYLGGWDAAYKKIIEQTWRNSVQRARQE
ncbi:MAG TPA: sulfate ABC transporter substrate-binding protein [Blastocatellia bacterium]|nr:sulfate ABC transporter substrate-binding protein [Blastocatellia bacterium]